MELSNQFRDTGLGATTSTSCNTEWPESLTSGYSFTLPFLHETNRSDGDGHWYRSSFNDHIDGREGHSAIWTGREMIIWGGRSSIRDGIVFNNGSRYNPSTYAWTSLAIDENCPSPRAFHSTIWTGSVMIVFGGTDGSSAFNDGAIYNPISDTWTPLSRDVFCPSERSSHAAVWTGNEMIVWGGRNGNSFLNTGSRYDVENDSWIQMSNSENTPQARYSPAAVWTGTEMITWGGGYSNGARYRPSDNSWIPIQDMESQAVSTAVWTGTEMIVWGSPKGARYNPAQNSWTVTAQSIIGLRSDYTAVWTGDAMIVWGGNLAGTAQNDGAMYFPSTDTWQPISTGDDCPKHRTGHSAVWTGTEMLIWGGNDIYWRDKLTGGRYSPSNDSWIPLGTNKAYPSKRTGHSAVWTGIEMIVWGGLDLDESIAYNSGSRYLPAMDAWIETSTDGLCPTSRYGHSAIWSGSEMIIWGGHTATEYNSGGKYDPLNDVWLSTSTNGDCPASRYSHAAVWTGTEMLIWGGATWNATRGAQDLDTGGRYNPVDDTWQIIPTGDGCPAARSFFTAIWSGEEMIIWGGWKGDYPTNTGGRYSPATNSWRPTSSSGSCPTNRGGHTAVWAGDEMIVWGGLSYFSEQSGGRYRPISDSWISTSTDPACPRARCFHSAIWTGQAMLIWGGITPGGYTDSAAQFLPKNDQWFPVANSNYCPSPRAMHSAFWTGSDMLIWGGIGGPYSFLISGGVYRPDSSHKRPVEKPE